MKEQNRLQNLPNSNDEDFWEGAEKYTSSPRSIKICSDHTKETWMKHTGYIDNKDGTISCKYCPWGARISGRYRVLDECIVDLKDFSSQSR